MRKSQATFWHIIYMTMKLIGIKLWILNQTKLLQKYLLWSCQTIFTQLSHLKKNWLGCWFHFAHVSKTHNQTLASWDHPKRFFYIITCIYELGALVCIVSYTWKNSQVLPLLTKKKSWGFKKVNVSKIFPTKNSVEVIKHLMARLDISCHQSYVGMLQESACAESAYRKRDL